MALNSKIGLAKDSLKGSMNCLARFESSLLLLTLSVWFSVCKALFLEKCSVGKDVQLPENKNSLQKRSLDSLKDQFQLKLLALMTKQSLTKYLLLKLSCN